MDEEKLYKLIKEREIKLEEYLKKYSANAPEFKTWYLANLAQKDKSIVDMANEIYSIEAKSVREVFVHIFEKTKAENKQLSDEEILGVVSDNIKHAGFVDYVLHQPLIFCGPKPKYKRPKGLIQSMRNVVRSTGLSVEEVMSGKPFYVKIITKEPEEEKDKD